MANKLKEQNRVVRAEIARKLATDIQRKNPNWTLQQVNAAAYKQADLQIKNGATVGSVSDPAKAAKEEKVPANPWRDEIAGKYAKVLARQNPSWTSQQVRSAAYKAADESIARDHAGLERARDQGKTP